MTMLIAAATAFLLMHLLIAGTRVRDAITGAIGEGRYMGLFSLASLAALIWFGFAFAGARTTPDNVVFWTITPPARHAAIGLVLIAFLIMVPGLLTISPTRVAGGKVVESPDAAKGMVRITRHPFLWGVVIWAGAHLVANGRLADLILFGTFLLLGLFGPTSIDGKRMRALGASYAAFKARTSNIPFAAIVQDRQTFSLGEIWWRLLVGLVVYALVLAAHPYLFGVNPLG